MVVVNGSAVPSCADLAKYLEQMGEVPLFSGHGWYVVTGFSKTAEGAQIGVIGCAPGGRNPRIPRFHKKGAV